MQTLFRSAIKQQRNRQAGAAGAQVGMYRLYIPVPSAPATPA